MTDATDDHRAFLRSLPLGDRERLLERSNWRGLLHLASHWGATLLIGGLVYLRIPFWWVLLLPLGILLIFNFTLAHEATHKTPFANETINEIVGHIAGFLVFVPFLWFRAFHLAHHRHTNDPEQDPEIKDSKRPEGWREYVIHLSGIGVWRSQLSGTFFRAFGTMDKSYVARSARRRLRIEAWFHVLLYILIIIISLNLSTNILILWILPIILGQPFLRLYLLAEHGRCPEVENMFENTRTVFTTRLIRWLAWNMPYHVEHHTFPQVPFHNLPELHGLIKSKLHVTENGYSAFHVGYVKHFD